MDQSRRDRDLITTRKEIVRNGLYSAGHDADRNGLAGGPVAAGGRLLDESEDRWRVADPEGNEMVIVSGA